MNRKEKGDISTFKLVDYVDGIDIEDIHLPEDDGIRRLIKKKKEKKTKEKITEFFKTIGFSLGIILLAFVLIFSIVGIIVLFVERTKQFNKEIYGEEIKGRKEKQKKVQRDIARKNKRNKAINSEILIDFYDRTDYY